MPRQRISTKKDMPKKSENKPRYIADRVIAVRIELGLTQVDVGRLLGVTGAAVQQAEHYNRALIYEMIVCFYINFKINPSWVIVKDNKAIDKFTGGKIQPKPNTKKDLVFDLYNKIGVLGVQLMGCKVEKDQLEDKIKELKAEKK